MLSSSISRHAGGLFGAVQRLSQSVQSSDDRHAVKVLSIRDAHTDADLPSWSPVSVSVFDAHGPAAFGFSPRLFGALRAMQPDLLHLHGIWMYPSVVSSRWGAGGRPYVITPHGMLDPWALRNSTWKKKVAGFLFENRNLERATCLHALNLAEADSIRRSGLHNPICVIPNGVDVPPPGAAAQEGVANSMAPDGKVLLFLGRLHPKKGLESLLNGWMQVVRSARSAGWRLVIAGWDQGGYEAVLRAHCSRSGLSDSVQFVGPQFGEDKAALLRMADAFILPSVSEGLPISILEAWSYSVPVLMTPACNLPDGFQSGAAFRIESDADSIASQLVRLFELSPVELRNVGARGLELVKRDHQWASVAAKMIAVYEWMLGNGPAPENLLQ